MLCLTLLCSFTGGCATWAGHGVVADPKYRIAIDPMRSTATIGSLANIESNPPKNADSPQAIDSAMRKVTTDLDAYLAGRLADSPNIQLVPPAANGKPVGAQAVLAVTLSGYGSIERKWLVYLIGSGVVEGLVQGVVVAKAVQSDLAGFAVGLEEIIQEILEWGGGAHLYDAYYSPITLQASLTSTKDNEEIWDDTVFVSIDKDALKKLPKTAQKKREVQLHLTAEKAVRELIGDLEDAAQRNLKKPQDITNMVKATAKPKIGQAKPAAKLPGTDKQNSS